MKKFLPTILIGMVFCIAFFGASYSFAQTTATLPVEGTWVKDADVTFAGKLAARAKEFLNSLLQSYQWYYLTSATSSSSLATFWITVRNIVYAFFALFVLVTAFIIIINRGRNMTLIKFIPRFLLIVLLVTFSFTVIQFIYQITDIVQGFFLRKNNAPLSVDQIINVSYDYQNFVGYRLFGPQYDESTFISLLLVKLTAVTMYVMAGVLFIRKIILWFFIIISPIFPLLLLYSPIRNTGKIWFGEFLKWLLYGPLFAIFLAGVVSLWGNTIFNTSASGSTYPTAVNILLGGPGQQVSIANSVNVPETFVLYIIALMMLWSTIILPFVLLQIFLNYFQTMSPDSSIVRQVMNMTSTFLNKPPTTPLPPSLQPAGMAKSLPIPAKAGLAREIQTASSQSTQVVRSNTINTASSNLTNRPVTISNSFNQPVTTSNQQFTQVTNNILQTANLRIPTLRDVAKLDSHAVTHRDEVQKEALRITSTLSTIANPHSAQNSSQRDQYRSVREQLIEEKQKGNPVASTILQAATAVSDKSTQKAGVVTSPQTFPVVNRVQSVSLEDYESVKKMWQENYTKLEAPKSLDGQQKDRASWIKEDIGNIEEAINKLQSHDPKIVKEGMNMVSSILPFLLIGGFSQTEIIAYLKAKLEAGKSTLSDIDKKQEEESTMVDRDEGKKEEQAQMTMSAEAPLEESTEPNDNKKI